MPATNIMIFWTAGISYIYLILVSFIVQPIGTFLHQGRSLAGRINHFYATLLFLIVNVIICYNLWYQRTFSHVEVNQRASYFYQSFVGLLIPVFLIEYTRLQKRRNNLRSNDIKSFYQSDMPLVWMDLIDIYGWILSTESSHIFCNRQCKIFCLVSRAVAELERPICTSGIWNGRRQASIGVKSTMP